MAKPKPTHPRRPLRASLEPIEPRLLLTATPTTTTLSLPAPLVTYTQSVTLTATVTTADAAHAPVPAGTVAFIEPPPTTYGTYVLANHTDRGTYICDPSTGIYQPIKILGTAPLAADGTASLTLSNLDDTFSSVRAVFLGTSPLILNNSYPLLTPSSPTTLAFLSLTSQVYSIDIPYGSTLALTQGKYLQLSPTYQPTADFLDSAPPGVLPVTPGPGGLSYPDFSPSSGLAPILLPPSNTPYLLTESSPTPGTLPSYYSLTITPFSLPDLPDQNNAYQSSLSTGLSASPDQPTTLHISTSWNFTYTNPPAITVSLSTPAGTSYSRHAPNPTPRGDYNKAHADLGLQVSTPPPTNGTASGEMNYDGSGPPFVPSGPFPTGTVSFFDEHNTLLATLPLDADGNATFYPNPRSLSLSSPHTIHAVYSGDSVFQPADASIGPFTLTHTPTRVDLQGLPSSIYSNTTLHLQGVVSTDDRDTVTPTGTLTFSVDGHTLTTLPALPGPPSTSDPVPSSIPLTLSLGDHTLTLSYSGDADCLPSSHTTIITVLQPITLPTDFPPPGYKPLGSGQIRDASVSTVRYVTFPSYYPQPNSLQFDVSADFTGTGLPYLPNPLFSFALSSDDVPGNADDIPLSTPASAPYISFAPFDSDGHYHFSTTYAVTLPPDLPAGPYHLVVTVDPTNALAETDETNNTLLSDPVTLPDPASPSTPLFGSDPDYLLLPHDPLPSPPVLPTTPPYLKASITPAQPTTSPNAPAALVLPLTNRRKKTLHRNYIVSYYLSTDRALSPDDTPFSKQIIYASLANNQSAAYTLPYKVPSSIPLGTRYLIAVADTPNHTPAARLVLASQKPLKIAGPHLHASISSTQPLGKRTRLTLRLTNTGPAPFTGPLKLRLTSSSTTNPLLRTLRRPNLTLAPHTSTTLTLTLPTRLLPNDLSSLSLSLL